MLLEQMHPEDVKAVIRKRYGTISRFIAAHDLPRTGVSDLFRGRTSQRVSDAVEAVLAEDARVYQLRLSASEPALVLAHRLYGGDADRRSRETITLEARAATIVARNRIAHPGFVPAGIDIELLTTAPDGGVRAA